MDRSETTAAPGRGPSIPVKVVAAASASDSAA